MSTNTIIIYGSFLLFILLGAFLFRLLFRERFPFDKVESIVTKTEKQFLQVLLSVVPNEDFYILTKVRLADIVKVRKDTNNYLKHFNKIKSKHIDFLICDCVDFEPLLAIELDDPSHLNEEAQDRDYVKNRVLESAGIPILRVKTQKKYDGQRILQDILNVIE